MTTATKIDPTATTETYLGMRNRHEREYNELARSLGALAFFAFGDRQLEQKIAAYKQAGGDPDKLVYAGAGMYGQEEAIDRLVDLSHAHNEEEDHALRTSREFAIQAFKAEMDNHEYGWSREDEVVLEALGLEEDDLVGDLADWYEEARKSYLEDTADYEW